MRKFVGSFVSTAGMALFAGFLMVACGGDPAPGTSPGGPGGGAPAAPSIALSLTDQATGQATNSLTLASPLNVSAIVRNAAGQPVANTIVQFSTSAPAAGAGGTALAVFSPASANGVTDANGRVTVALSAGGAESAGAANVTATATVDGADVTASTAFQVAAANVMLQAPTLNPATIDAFQTSTVSVTVTGVAPSTPVTVNFRSTCAEAGLATLTPSALTVNGVATATYTDKGCGRADAIAVSSAGAAGVQATLTVRAAAATNLVFVSTSPEAIGIRGSGGNTSALVTFRVVNASQQPVANVPVMLELDTAVGGITLENGQTALTKNTASDGTVAVQVIAGTQPTPVRVLASSGALRAVSSQLSIRTGLPTQDRFSLAVETFNIEGFDFDGTTTGLTIRAADRVGNPAPDGTVINFRSSGAAVQPTCSTMNGACTVTIVSQANRPANGRITLLAYASGLESFDDLNGNNVYDAGEVFRNLGNAFVDANFDGAFQTGEEFIPFNANANSTCAPSTQAVPIVPDTCDAVWGNAHVRAALQVVLSGSTATTNLPATATLVGMATCSTTIAFQLADVRGNPMPRGTTISATAPTGVTATVVAGTVVNTNGGPTSHAIDLNASTCGGRSGNLRVNVTTPLGLTTIFTVGLNF